MDRINARISFKGIIIATLPGLLMFALILSLAVHMHGSLGGWPSTIGESGFPPGLIVHAKVTLNYFYGLFISLMVLPVPIAVILLIERWRHFAAYVAAYAGSLILYFGLFLLVAPNEFLNWWWD